MMRTVVFTDQPVIALGVQAVLAETGIDVICVSALSQMDEFKALQPEIVLIDLEALTSIRTLAEVRAKLPLSRLVLRTRTISRDLIYHALEYEVRGILPSQLPVERLGPSLERIASGELLIEITKLLVDCAGESRVRFSNRQWEVVELVAKGLKNKEIATVMNVEEGTVKQHLYRICKKTKVRDRFELLLYHERNRHLIGKREDVAEPLPGVTELNHAVTRNYRPKVKLLSTSISC